MKKVIHFKLRKDARHSTRVGLREILNDRGWLKAFIVQWSEHGKRRQKYFSVVKYISAARTYDAALFFRITKESQLLAQRDRRN